MPANNTKTLANKWSERQNSYDFIVIGSGYGGSITAARLANSAAKPSVCILERGKEWPVGTFPDSVGKALPEFRSSANPLGLYEILNYRDISVVKGSGLGGTSLINANVAIVPNREIFERTEWPRSLKYDSLLPYYVRARNVLDAHPHPNGSNLAKVMALNERAKDLGLTADPLNIAVNFTIDGTNPYGMQQAKCIDCGDCVSGCNVGAKNTLYMNFLPMAKNGGAQIFTQTKVEWIEKIDGGGWRVRGRYVEGLGKEKKFTLDAKNVILSAGSVNSTEILLRSEMHGLKISPAVGTRFSGNGNFFGLAYNSDGATNVLGYGTRRKPGEGEAPYPGPTIVSAIRYTNLPASDRIAIEDLTFPSAVVGAAETFFTALPGEDADTGDEADERERVRRDFLSQNQYQPDGALNHTMFYLVTGPDDARGTMVFDAPWFERDGRMRIEWDNAGRQVLFTRINEELRRHSRKLGATFVSNPLWNLLEMRRLITVHPLGGCPMGEDHLHGATDEFGRIFAQDGGIHEGLFVADGALLPSATGVNPFMTISALSERIAERKIEEMAGKPYPAPPVAVSFTGLDPVEMTRASESELERIFRRTTTLGIDEMINQGGPPVIDIAARTVRNDQYWKGFFPRGHILNVMSSAIFTGFKKQFSKEGKRYVGLTTDTDGRIRARNSLEEVTLPKAEGTLEEGKYMLLKYLEPPWQGFYDIFKVINKDLLIGRVYLGEYPNGARMFTFAMTRTHGFDRITVDEHRALFAAGTVPTPDELNGVWRMDVVSNNNQLGSAAHLAFEKKPDGRLESRYQAMGLFEGMVVPSFTQDHFQLNDFTPFHDEIRKVDDNLMVGKWVAAAPAGLGPLLNQSLGIFHPDEGGRLGFYYLITRTAAATLPTNPLLQPFLDVRLPDGLGMKFDEEMVGWFAEGQHDPAGAKPAEAVACSFNVTMNVRDLNEFVDGADHEASLNGTITFERLAGSGPVTCQIDPQDSSFNYLRINPETHEAEMRYHLEFQTSDGREYTLDGRKFMQKDEGGGLRGIREVLEDYTTLFCHVYERQKRKQGAEIGAALLKFRTFEDIAAIGNLAGFLRSFRVTGTDNPVLKIQGQMRFLAFTAQFVQREYDPLSPDIGRLSADVRAEVQRGADTPDYFSTQATADLQRIQRETPTLGLEKLLNTGAVRIDYEKRRIFRDSFWKGSFAKDSLLGAEEQVRNSLLGSDAAKLGSVYTGGSFWKRFDRIENGAARGQVVNYEMAFLPGDPEVREMEYPDDNRKYFRKGDKFLLLNYRNLPYKIVYDTIKVIDENNAIGVMHLGEFPNGIEFASFVMARHNYPFEKMSVEDHNLIFADPRTKVPEGAQLEGEWDGHVVFITRPSTTLLNQVNPVAFRLSFHQASDGKIEGRYRLGLLSGEMEVARTPEFVRLIDFTSFHDEIRMIDEDTLIGKWVSPELNPDLLTGLGSYLEPRGDRFAFYYILKSTKAGAVTGG